MYEIGEYEGHPIIKLLKQEGDKWPFSFGLAKAKLILDNIKEIEEFVRADGKMD